MGAFDLSRYIYPDLFEGRQPQQGPVDVIDDVHSALMPGVGSMQRIKGPAWTLNNAAAITPKIGKSGRSVNNVSNGYWSRANPFQSGPLTVCFSHTPSTVSGTVGLWGLADTFQSGGPNLLVQRAGANLSVYHSAGFRLTITGAFSVGVTARVALSIFRVDSGFSQDNFLAFNGVIYALVSTTTGFTSLANEFLGSGYNGQGAGDFGEYFAIQRRCSSAELASFTKDPYQVFTQPDLGIYQIFSAGSTSAVSSDSTANYNVLGNVQSSTPASYGIRSAVQSSSSADYNVLGVAQQNGAATYAVRGEVSSDAAAAYNILSATSVTSSATAGYNIIGNLANDGPANYAILGAALKDSAATYSIRNAVTQDAAASYSILSSGAVTASVTAGYAIKGTLQSSIVAGYAIAAAVQAEIASSYFIHQAVAKDALPAYLICGAVSKAITAAYAVDGATGVAYARAPSGAGPQLIQPAAQRPAQTVSARPSNTGGTRY